jgi:hypothetical protein
MAPAAPSTAPAAERQWFIVGRWQEYEGEARANLLRVLAVAAFYGIELINYHGLELGALQLPRVESVSQPFHMAVTALAVVWTLAALGIALCLRQRVFPWSLKFLSTGIDLVLLTWILALAGGPRSPLLVGYFLVVCLSGLRFNLSLVWFATGGAVAGYLFLLGYVAWYGSAELRVPRYYELIFLLALVLCGVLIGQVLRRVRRLAEDYARRLTALPGGPP